MSKLYAGDLSPKEAWESLKNDPDAFLIDVRTSTECHFVGGPDVSSLNKVVHNIEFLNLPGMEKNPNFEEKLSSIALDKNAKIFFICHLGGRSTNASINATKLGYTNCYNIKGGFVGDKNNNNQRGLLSGWKGSSLPWRQD